MYQQKKAMKPINYESLKRGASTISSITLDARGSGYLRTYPMYRDFFGTSEIVSKQDFVIRSSIVYSWMPRVMVLQDNLIDDAIQAIRAFTDTSNEANEIEVLSKVATALNGSYIGLRSSFISSFPTGFPSLIRESTKP